MYSESKIIKVVQHYFSAGDIGPDTPNITISDIKTGLIHNSYRFSSLKGDWLIQRINTTVFKDVHGLMGNIDRVTSILRTQFEGTPYETLSLKKSIKGESFVEVDGEAWRIYDFKKHLVGYHGPKNREMVFEAGKAFARFTDALSDLKPDDLTVTIPNFHSLKYRIEQLEQAKQNPKVALRDVDWAFERIDKYYKKLVVLEEAMDSRDIPTRITHNDAKFNNLLFDADGKARCVVDLDTVMPGIIHFDIGDCLRTLVPNIPEDSPDLERLLLDFSFERDFLSGYLEVARPWITDAERELLPLSGPYMALIMGIRFLTDHINGNVYFSCDYAEQNLIRAKNQLDVVELWEVGSRK